MAAWRPRRAGQGSRGASGGPSCAACLLQAQGELAAAAASIEEGLALKRAQFGAGHPDLATFVHALVNVWWALGERERALEAQRRALADAEAAVGPFHPQTGLIRQTLVLRLKAVGAYDEARTRLRQALARESGENARVARWETLLADFELDEGRFAEAEPRLARAVAITERLNGKDSVKLFLPLSGLVRALVGLGRLAEAEATLQRLGAILGRESGRESATEVDLLVLEGTLRIAQGRRADAESCFRRARELAARVTKEGVAAPTRMLAGLLCAARRTAPEGLQLAEQAVALTEKSAPGSRDEAEARATLAACRAAASR